METDEYELDRFVIAQQDCYVTALSEIRQGAKRSHWMWYIFPQIAGLGHSNMASRYALRSLGEARAYLAHPLLGRRLRECVGAIQDLPGGDARDMFGDVDALKLRSSLTLFEAANDERMFGATLDRWFGGTRDRVTLDLLRKRL